MKDILLNKELPHGVIVIFTSKEKLVGYRINSIFEDSGLGKFKILYQTPCAEFNEGFIITRRLNLGNIGQYATISMSDVDLEQANYFDLIKFTNQVHNIISFDQRETIEFKYTPPLNDDPNTKYSLRDPRRKPIVREYKPQFSNFDENEDYDLDSESVLDKCLSIFFKPDTRKIDNHETDLADKVEYDKATCLDLISTLVLDYAAKFQEMPPIEEIRKIIRGKLHLFPHKLSKLVVDADFNIILVDYDSLEIKLTPLLRTIYILFLLHPEGIVLKQIGNYREEIESIYLFIKPSGDNRLMKASIDDICNPLSDSLRQKLSKINRIVNSVIFDENLADYYTINGIKGNEYSIQLSQDLKTLPQILLHC